MSEHPSEASRTPSRPPQGQRPQRPPGTFKVGTIAGSDVLVTSSWFLIAALIAWVVAPRVDQVAPGLGGLKYVAGFAFAVILYLSVLLHEASHAYMARHYGYQVSSITLHFLGGATAIEGEARTPRQELMIAVVGPLTSIGVGLAALALWFVTPDGLLLMAVEGLAGANLIVGVLNLVPGLPLDGGRVLKSIVWGATGDMLKGTVVAAWTGRMTAVAALAWPLLQEPLLGTTPDVFDVLLAGMVALFLWTAASSALQSARARSSLPALVARRLARRALAVPDDLPLAEAVRRAQGGRGRQPDHRHRDRSADRPGQRGRARRHARGTPALGGGLHGRAHHRAGHEPAGDDRGRAARARDGRHAGPRVPPRRGRRQRLRRAVGTRRRARLPPGPRSLSRRAELATRIADM